MSLLDLKRKGEDGILGIRGIGGATADDLFNVLRQILFEIEDRELDFWPAHPFLRSSALNMVGAAYAHLVEREQILFTLSELETHLKWQRDVISDVEFATKPYGWIKTLTKKSRLRVKGSIKSLESIENGIGHHYDIASQLVTNFNATNGMPSMRSILDTHYAANENDYLTLLSRFLPRKQMAVELVKESQVKKAKLDVGASIPFTRANEKVYDKRIEIVPTKAERQVTTVFSAPDNRLPIERIIHNQDIVTSTRPPLLKKLQWVPSGEVVKLGGRMIEGMVYTSDVSLGWDGEPSAICKRLPVDSNQVASDELPYYPNYESLSPGQRAFYLDWLAGGRRMSNPDQLPTGYLFLFFYGIERRFIVEGDRDSSLWDEVFKLLEIYGMTRRSRSVPSYFGDFLHFTSYSLGVEGYSSVLPGLLDMQDERLSETALGIALAHHFRANQPIDWKLAHLVAMGLEDSRRSVVIKRTGNAFREMFTARFRETYPDGMVLKASRRDRAVRYQTGNASLSPRYSNPSRAGGPFVIQIPGVLGIKSQFKPLAGIWNQCIEDLSGYSRAVGKLTKEAGASSQDLLRAHLALPDEIRGGKPHPLEAPYRETLASCPNENGLIFAPVALLACMSGIEERQELTQKQSEDVAALVESFGDTLAPHPIILNLPLAWDQEVAIFRNPVVCEPSKSLGGLLRLLHLAVLMASADGVIDDDELQVFHRSSGIEDEFGKAQIRATEAVLVRDTNVANRRLQKIAKSVHSSDRMAVFKLMVHIACCDAVLSSDENRMLRRLGKALKLGQDSLDDVLAGDAAFHTVTVVRGRKASEGETIPAPASSPAFRLDMDRINALTLETAEVVSILSRAIEEEPEEEDELEPESTVRQPITEAPEWMTDLDERYRAALLEMVGTAQGQSFDLDEIAGRYHLLPDDLIDGVNTWSDETLGDFLIELDDEGQVSIIEELIPNT